MVVVEYSTSNSSITYVLAYKTVGIELYFLYVHLFWLWVEFATTSSLMGSSWLIASTYFYRGRARVEKLGKKKKMAQFELGKVCIVLHPYLYVPSRNPPACMHIIGEQKIISS